MVSGHNKSGAATPLIQKMEKGQAVKATWPFG
jgi:hypothetical protein